MNCFHCAALLSLHSTAAFPTPLKNERCHGCGIFIKNCLDFYYCNAHLEYLICSECRLCKKAHFMQKCLFLTNINSLYHNNTYGCDICAKTKQVNDNGIWHCSKCSYDVCDVCLP